MKIFAILLSGFLLTMSGMVHAREVSAESSYGTSVLNHREKVSCFIQSEEPEPGNLNIMVPAAGTSGTNTLYEDILNSSTQGDSLIVSESVMRSLEELFGNKTSGKSVRVLEFCRTH